MTADCVPQGALRRVLLLGIVLICLIWSWYRRQNPRPSSGAVQRQRLLKPRTPDDCPVCRQYAAPTDNVVARPAVTPWSAVKSRRGAPKRIATQRFACPNRRCAYSRITDAQVHALVGDGAHGDHHKPGAEHPATTYAPPI